MDIFILQTKEALQITQLALQSIQLAAVFLFTVYFRTKRSLRYMNIMQGLYTCKASITVNGKTFIGSLAKLYIMRMLLVC